MDPEYPYPDSQNLAVGLYLNQLNQVYPVQRNHFNNFHSKNREFSYFNPHRVFSLQNLNAFITIQNECHIPHSSDMAIRRHHTNKITYHGLINTQILNATSK
jgi:hypothetical protein